MAHGENTYRTSIPYSDRAVVEIRKFRFRQRLTPGDIVYLIATEAAIG
jgi:hypothetical protein